LERIDLPEILIRGDVFHVMMDELRPDLIIAIDFGMTCALLSPLDALSFTELVLRQVRE